MYIFLGPTSYVQYVHMDIFHHTVLPLKNEFSVT